VCDVRRSGGAAQQEGGKEGGREGEAQIPVRSGGGKAYAATFSQFHWPSHLSPFLPPFLPSPLIFVRRPVTAGQKAKTDQPTVSSPSSSSSTTTTTKPQSFFHAFVFSFPGTSVCVCVLALCLRCLFSSPHRPQVYVCTSTVRNSQKTPRVEFER